MGKRIERIAQTSPTNQFQGCSAHPSENVNLGVALFQLFCNRRSELKEHVVKGLDRKPFQSSSLLYLRPRRKWVASLASGHSKTRGSKACVVYDVLHLHLRIRRHTCIDRDESSYRMSRAGQDQTQSCCVCMPSVVSKH